LEEHQNDIYLFLLKHGTKAELFILLVFYAYHVHS